MTHLENLTKLRETMIQEILLHMKENNLQLIKFKQMFSCIMPEDSSGEYGPVFGSYIAKRMWDNGVVEGINEGQSEWAEWEITDLDTLEVAYILDTLDAAGYVKLDPDSYDVNEDDDDSYDEEDN